MTSYAIVASAIGIGGAIGGICLWMSRHITNNRKHPCKDEIVFQNVCEERGKTNSQAHNHLKEGIETAIKRSDEQHTELKADMRNGFAKIEVLIVKNGR